MAAPLLSLRHVSKTYPSGTRALVDVNLDVRAGEFVAIIGLSGSGKSTLLRCLNRLIEPSEGHIFYMGEDTRALELRKLRSQIAMVFQNFNLVPRHTVLSNVLAGALARTGTLRSIVGAFSPQDKKMALEFLEVVGIRDKAYVRADHLSGGQQQRVAIARALMQKPQVLLADEPVASLDPATSHGVMDYLRKINREMGITVICNLHFLSLVRDYANRAVALKSGQLIYDANPQSIDQDWFKKIYGESAQEVQIR